MTQRNFIGPGTDWDNPAHWSTGVVPGPGDIAYFQDSSPSCTLTGPVSFDQLFFSTNWAGTFTNPGFAMHLYGYGNIGANTAGTFVWTAAGAEAVIHTTINNGAGFSPDTGVTYPVTRIVSGATFAFPNAGALLIDSIIAESGSFINANASVDTTEIGDLTCTGCSIYNLQNSSFEITGDLTLVDTKVNPNNNPWTLTVGGSGSVTGGIMRFCTLVGTSIECDGTWDGGSNVNFTFINEPTVSTWTGNGNTDAWNNEDNWDISVPNDATGAETSLRSAVIPDSSTVDASSAGTIELWTLTLQGATGFNGSINFSGTILKLNNGGTLQWDNANSSGTMPTTINLTGGALTLKGAAQSWGSMSLGVTGAPTVQLLSNLTFPSSTVTTIACSFDANDFNILGGSVITVSGSQGGTLDNPGTTVNCGALTLQSVSTDWTSNNTTVTATGSIQFQSCGNSGSQTSGVNGGTFSCSTFSSTNSAINGATMTWSASGTASGSWIWNCTNTVAKAIDARTNSVDNGGNTNFAFQSSLFIFTGATNTSPTVATNWAFELVPNTTQKIRIDASMTLASLYQIGEMSFGVGFSGTFNAAGNTIRLNGTSSNGNGLILPTTGTITLALVEVNNGTKWLTTNGRTMASVRVTGLNDHGSFAGSLTLVDDLNFTGTVSSVWTGAESGTLATGGNDLLGGASSTVTINKTITGGGLITCQTFTLAQTPTRTAPSMTGFTINASGTADASGGGTLTNMSAWSTVPLTAYLGTPMIDGGGNNAYVYFAAPPVNTLVVRSRNRDPEDGHERTSNADHHKTQQGHWGETAIETEPS